MEESAVFGDHLRVAEWIWDNSSIESAVLFGSSARIKGNDQDMQRSSDIDIHLIVSRADDFERLDWRERFKDLGFCLQVSRPATGGVRKVTVVFEAAQFDLVVVPRLAMRLARMALGLGFYGRNRKLTTALNEMATCLHTGYRFLKGSQRWGEFYKRVGSLSGVSMSDVQISSVADCCLCDALWVFQKIHNGELVAAQYVMHSKIIEANLRLWRELKMRAGYRLPSYGIGRHVETLALPEEHSYLIFEARLNAAEMKHAVWAAIDGLRKLMQKLNSGWTISAGMTARFDLYR